MVAIALLTFLFILLQSCSSKDEEDVKIENLRDNKLVAITGYNAYSYFIYKGQPMGFEYELVKKLAKYFNVDLEVKIVNNIEEMFEMLNSGKGDLIAFNLTITKERLEKVDFTKSINTIKQVLVQRKPENWEKMKLHEIEKQLIRDPAELIGKTVFVRSNSAYVQRLINLSDEIGGDINIMEAEPELTTEDLIAQVSSGEIDYTISDDNIAHLNSVYYRNIDAKTDISLSQRIAWAVEKDSDVFESAVNKWLDSMKATVDFAVIYKKYFTNRYAFKKRITSEYFSNTGGGISKYDDLIKKYSELVGWDWRLSASLVYQESQFNPNTKSWAGAVGLMQLMPNTAKQFGITNLKNPEQNINGGFKYLTYLDNLWKESITDSTERIKFVLASYNVGPGHITDARNLTEKYEGDPDIWFDNVEVYLKLKSKPKYYNDEVVKRGYARGKETVKYVKEILERYEQYKQLIK
ncbi:MAG: transporter substrate-binding domain-containing protein [Bacteroidetes bacterium]|nr:transporter substrate-binding domain-containing protein [Bacteroidota bacterium]